MKTVHATSFSDFVTPPTSAHLRPLPSADPAPPILPEAGWERRLADLRKVAPIKVKETILHRASFLPETDRALITAHFSIGQSMRALALATRTSKSALIRRKRAILDRLLHPAFLVVLFLGPTWPKQQHAAARMIFIEGQSMRAVSRSLGMGYAAVRVIRNLVEALVAKLLAENKPTRTCA